jgi:hypothetical protein
MYLQQQKYCIKSQSWIFGLDLANFAKCPEIKYLTKISKKNTIARRPRKKYVALYIELC